MLTGKKKKGVLNSVIEEIAKREGISTQEVRSAMQEAIQEGFNDPNPIVHSRWEEISNEGSVPNPETVILWAVERIVNLSARENEQGDVFEGHEIKELQILLVLVRSDCLMMAIVRLISPVCCLKSAGILR